MFSGTTEGRRFSKKLAELGVAVTVCVATPLGAEEQGEMAGITVHAGRLQPDAMAALPAAPSQRAARQTARNKAPAASGRVSAQP